MSSELSLRIIDYIKDDLLKWFLKPIPEVSPEDVWSFRNKLHALHHFAVRSGLPEEIRSQIEAMLQTSASLWHLIFDNLEVLDSVKDYHNVRMLDANAGILSEVEEIISGEETPRDVLIEAIAIYLGWRADTIWIDSAWKEHKASVHNYLLELQDHMWEFFNADASPEGEPSFEKAKSLGRLMDRMAEMILDENIPSTVQVNLLIRLYHLLLRLQIGRLIIQIEGI